MSDAKPSRVSWQDAAAEKRAAVNALIPDAWRINPVPSVEEQPNVTGDYIRQFLTPRETEITETDTTDILAKTTTGIWTAKEVTLAFCHRAALGHQLVSNIAGNHSKWALTSTRSTAYTKYFSMLPLPLQKRWMRILQSIRSPQAHYMGCQSV